jgi:hypothetical protein
VSELDGFTLPPFTPEPQKQEANPAPVGRVEVSQGLPSSVYTEVAILGALMLDGVALKDAVSKLNPEDFSLDSHQRVFKAVVALLQDGMGVDITTVRAELTRRREIDTVGGPAYLAYLTEGIPHNINIESYVQIVKDKSILRQLMGIFHDAQVRAGDQSEDGFELFKDVEERLAEMAAGGLRIRKDRNILIGAMDFIRDTPLAVEWTVEGLIQKGGNGIVVGDPGSAKSFTTLDLAHHLVAGVEWMGHKIPVRMKVAYIAREDHAGLTQHRGLSLLKGYAGGTVDYGLSEVEINEWLYYNTRAQSETFSLQNEMDVLEIIDAFKDKGIEIAFFDVFRRLWEGDENDNREVAKVLATLTRIQTECNCSVALVHHLNKSEGGTIFQRIRGAGSIYGWREWAFGISIENPEDDPKDRIRKIVFETKAATPSVPVYYCFAGDNDKVMLESCAAPAKSYKSSKKKGDEPKQDVIAWYEKTDKTPY